MITVVHMMATYSFGGHGNQKDGNDGSGDSEVDEDDCDNDAA